MNPKDETGIESVLKQRITDIASLVNSARYFESLKTIRAAKAAYPKNIFIIALEKQLEKLVAFQHTADLSDPPRQKELLDSIPTLVRRAVEQIDNEEPASAHGSSPRSNERKAAFANLKSQYFQLADRHIEEGNYLAAQQEIHRVLILEPENTIAKEYQRRIRDFEDRRVVEPTPKTVVTHEENQKPDVGPIQPPRTRTVTAAKQSSQSETKKAAGQKQTRAKQQRRPLPKQLLMIGIPVLVGLLGGLYFFVEPRPSAKVSSNSTPATAPLPPPQSEAANTVITRDQPAQHDSQSSPATNNGNEQLLSDSTSNSAGATFAEEARPSEATSISPARVFESEAKKESESTKAAPGIVPSTFAVNATSKVDVPSAKPSPNVPQLTKLEITSNLSTQSSVPESPVPVPFTERKPEVIRLANPKFPAAAQNAGIDGEVLVKVLINAEGKPIRTKILKSSNDMFNDSVIEAVMNSEYSPGMMPSGPVTTWVAIPFTFKRR